MLGRLWPRFALEACFLVAVAIAAGAADLSTAAIVGVMIVAYLATVAVEWTASRARRAKASIMPQPQPAGSQPAGSQPAGSGLLGVRPARSDDDAGEGIDLDGWKAVAAEHEEEEKPEAEPEPEPEPEPDGEQVATESAEAEDEPEASPEPILVPVPAPATVPGPMAEPEPDPGSELPPAAETEPEPELELELEPEEAPAAPVLALAAPPPEPEPEPELEPEAEPERVVALPLQAQPREWNVWELERLTRERTGADPLRDEEWGFLLVYLRDFASPDGVLPTDFDALVRESFGELLAAAR